VGRWVPVDPFFDQFPADAGHLRLGAGGAIERVLSETVLRSLRVLSVEGQ